MIEAHCKKLMEGLEVWNKWRNENEVLPDLEGADFAGVNLSSFNLSGSNLRGTNLEGANLKGVDLEIANLRGANLREAILTGASCYSADFKGANLEGASLRRASLNEANIIAANLKEAYLSGADLREASLNRSNLCEAVLSEVVMIRTELEKTDFTKCKLNETVFGLTDLSTCIGMETIEVSGKCIIDFETLQNSQNLPQSFLRKIGLPNLYIDYLPEFINKPLNLFPVFLSHSWENKDFAHKLYQALIDKGVLVWFDEKKMMPGDKLISGISKGINTYDKLILVCSKSSLNSWWVKEELERIFEKERRHQQEGSKESLLIPVTIDNYIFNSNNEYASTIKKHLIGDFKQWQNESIFEKSLKQLVDALKVNRNEKDPVSFL